MSHHRYQHIWDRQMFGNSIIQSFSFFLLLYISFIHIFSLFLEPIVGYRQSSKMSNLWWFRHTWLSCENFWIGISHLNLSLWLNNLFLVAREQLGDSIEEIWGSASSGSRLGWRSRLWGQINTFKETFIEDK